MNAPTGDRLRILCSRAGTEELLTPEGLAALVERGDEPLWVDVDSTDEEQHAILGRIFGFHPLAIEDTLNPHTRVKIEEYEGYLFIVLRAMRFDRDKPLSADRPEATKLCLFLGRNYLVSVHAGPEKSIADAAVKLKQSSGVLLREGGPGRVAHLIGDAVIDAYFPILDVVDDFVDRLEHLEPIEFERMTLTRIVEVRRLAFAAHRSLVPQREIFDALAHKHYALVSPDSRLYFRDVYDHALRITESLDAYRDLISETTDSYIAQISMRLGTASKVFSAVATVVIPFLLISGIYGMNFTVMPLTRSPIGFWLVLGAQAFISLATLAFLRVRRLI